MDWNQPRKVIWPAALVAPFHEGRGLGRSTALHVFMSFWSPCGRGADDSDQSVSSTAGPPNWLGASVQSDTDLLLAVSHYGTSLGLFD